MSPKRAKADSDPVSEFMARLEHPRKAEIEVLRALILGADERVREGIKWNAPSFYITDHFATFKLRPEETVQLVLHTGAKVKGEPRPIQIEAPEGMLTWPAPDRCIVTLADRNEVEARRDVFVQVIQQWIEQTRGLVS